MQECNFCSGNVCYRNLKISRLLEKKNSLADGDVSSTAYSFDITQSTVTLV